MKLEGRLRYISLLLLGILFIVTGIALNELNILTEVTNGSLDSWYVFLMPWIGALQHAEQNGAPASCLNDNHRVQR